MALKQVTFNYTLNKEKHQVKITDCPTCVSTCEQTKVLELPFLKSCGTCQDVALKLKDSALVVQDCEETIKLVILGTITSWTQLVDSGGCPLSEYLITFQYDDSQIVGAAQLTYNDIDDWDCFSVGDEYLDAKISCVAESTLEQNLSTGEITFTNGDGDTFTAEVTSADADNLLTTGSDGGSFLSDVNASRTVSAGEADSGTISTVVTSVGTYTLDTGGIVTIVNPSASATMRVLKMIACGVSGTFIPGHIGSFIVEISVDGGAFSTYAFKNWKNSGATDFIGDLVPVSNVDSDTLIAISGNYSIQLRLKYQTTTQGSGGGGVSSLYAFFNTYRMLGFVGNNT